jgi:hypothetical protein
MGTINARYAKEATPGLLELSEEPNAAYDEGNIVKILVLGTSNSIMSGGWVEGMASVLEAEYENRSVGASPCTQFSMFMKEDLSKYDYVFFDSIPNDESIEENFGSAPYVDDLLFEILSTISAQTNLIVLGFCKKTFLRSGSIYFDRHERIARSVGAQFIDIRKLLRSIADTFELSDWDVYEDEEAHPKARISYIVGQTIGQILSDGDRIPASPDKTAVENYSANFTILDAFPDFETRSYANRLMHADFHILTEGDRLEFPMAKLVGLYVNMPSTSCYAVLEGVDGNRSLDMHFRILPDTIFIKHFNPVVDGFECRSLTVSFEPSGAVQPSIYSVSDTFHSPAQTLIEKLCFWSGGGACKDRPIEGYDYLAMSEAIYNELLSEKPEALSHAANEGIVKLSIRKKQLAKDLKSESKFFALQTYFETIVVYDHQDNTIKAVKVEEMTGHSTIFSPVEVEVYGDRRIYLRVMANGQLTYIKKHQDRLVLSDEKIIFKVETVSNGYHIMADGLYASVQPNGSLMVNRRAAEAWEKFKIHVIDKSYI